MALTASIGHAQALNGREAGLQATHQALNKLGSGSPGFRLCHCVASIPGA